MAEMIEVSKCAVCGKHITRCPKAPNPVWFHTPSFSLTPNDHRAVPTKVKQEPL